MHYQYYIQYEMPDLLGPALGSKRYLTYLHAENNIMKMDTTPIASIYGPLASILVPKWQPSLKSEYKFR